MTDPHSPTAGRNANPPDTDAPSSHDWTANVEGRSNSSLAFHAIAATIERLIRDDAHMLISGRADKTARLIVAQMAHKFGMAPDEARPDFQEAMTRWAIEGTDDAT